MKKNNNRMYVILAVVAMLGLSWYKLLSTATTKQQEYDGYLAEARSAADIGIRDDAYKAYENARDMHDSIELRKEIADFYHKHYDQTEWGEYCEEVVEAFPKEALAYEIVMDYYYTIGDYAMCYQKYEEADKKDAVTDSMKKKYDSLYYATEELSRFVDVGEFSGGMCAVTTISTDPVKWGYIDDTGAMKIGLAYLDACGFTNSGFAAVKQFRVTDDPESGTEYVLIDETGEVKHADPKKDERTITEMGLFSSGKIAAQINGKYCYMNENFEALYGNFDYATTYAGDIAVAKNGDKWIIINENGEQIGSETFEDIKLDRTKIAFRNDVAFAQINGKYYLIDKMGKVVCDTAFEDADAFASEGYAAVKYEGAWGYVNTKGEFVIKPQYMQARSFTNDLGAVSDGTEWAYIDTNNYIVIRGGGGETEEENRELMFEDAKQFSDNGSTFVKVNGEWTQIRLYRQALS